MFIIYWYLINQIFTLIIFVRSQFVCKKGNDSHSEYDFRMSSVLSCLWHPYGICVRVVFDIWMRLNLGVRALPTTRGSSTTPWHTTLYHLKTSGRTAHDSMGNILFKHRLLSCISSMLHAPFSKEHHFNRKSFLFVNKILHYFFRWSTHKC